jgi:hypothetical protein
MKKIALSLLATLFAFCSFAQIGIGTTFFKLYIRHKRVALFKNAGTYSIYLKNLFTAGTYILVV